MYVPKFNEENDVPTLHSLIESNPLGTWTTIANEDITANHIPFLLDMLLLNQQEEIEKEITKLLGNVKDKAAVPVFIEALQNEKYIEIRKTICTACWQNGLHYHEYMPTFLQIIITGDWETAFEAFTVIDNMEFLPGEDIIEQIKRIIAPELKTANEQKKYFLEEILSKIA